MTEPLQLLVVMDDPAGIDPVADTTLALITAACRRRHAVDVCGPGALGLAGPDLIARAAPVLGTRTDRVPAIVTGRSLPRAVAGYDAVLMRKDPPFDLALRSILETATDRGRQLVMAQRYLPEARDGDKRILLLDGEPLGAVLRVPAAGDARGNFHAGAAARRTELTARDREICTRVGADCRRRGLALVGIDVIGDHLTEINVTSPTGLRQINRLEDIQLEDTVVDWLETRCVTRRSETTHRPARDASTRRTRRATVRNRQGAVIPWPSPSLS